MRASGQELSGATGSALSRSFWRTARCLRPWRRRMVSWTRSSLLTGPKLRSSVRQTCDRPFSSLLLADWYL